MRQVVLAQRDLDFHPGIGVAAEDLCHPREGFALRRGLLDDLDDDDVAGLGGSALLRRHQQILVDSAVLGDDEGDAALLVEAADDRAVRAFEHVDDLAFGPAAPVGADAPDRRAIAVQHLVHLARAQENVGRAIVRHEKAEAVGVALHGAGDEVELRHHAQLALAIHEQLAVALHRVDAAEERVACALVDGEETHELGGRQRHARALQRVEDRAARGQQRRIDVVAAAARRALERRIRGRRARAARRARAHGCREFSFCRDGGLLARTRRAPRAGSVARGARLG